MTDEPWPYPVTIRECTGQCCDTIWINADYVEHLFGAEWKPKETEESAIIADMLINPIANGDSVSFECRHFDLDTAKCKIYENRPIMCQGYPYEKTCKWCGGKVEVNNDSNV